VFGLSYGIFSLVGDNVADFDHLLKDDILLRHSQTINCNCSVFLHFYPPFPLEDLKALNMPVSLDSQRLQ